MHAQSHSPRRSRCRAPTARRDLAPNRARQARPHPHLRRPRRRRRRPARCLVRRQRQSQHRRHCRVLTQLWLVTVVERAILARIFTNDDVQHDGFIDYHCDTALVFDLLAEDSAKRDLMQQHLVSIIFGVIIVFRFFDCFIDELGVCF